MSLSYFEVQYANFNGLEVLIDPQTKEMWVTQPTMERLLGWEPETARKKIVSKSLKAFVGKDLAGAKSVKAKDILGRPNNCKAIPYDDFLKVLYWQVYERNQAAIKLAVAGFGDSFRSLVFEQAGIALEDKERQQWLIDRLESKTLFWDLTEAIKDTMESQGKTPQFYHYSNAMDAINRSLFGKSAKKIRDELGLKSGLTRDNFGRKALRWLTTVQEGAAIRIRKGLDPVQSVKEVIEAMGYKQIDYRD